MKSSSLLDTDIEFAELYQRHADMVYRLCYIYLKNPVDVEDAVQSVFLKLINTPMVFNDHEHEKAWLTVTTKNYCKDILKHWWRTRRVALEPLPEIVTWNGIEPSGKVVSKLLSLLKNTKPYCIYIISRNTQ